MGVLLSSLIVQARRRGEFCRQMCEPAIIKSSKPEGDSEDEAERLCKIHAAGFYLMVHVVDFELV